MSDLNKKDAYVLASLRRIGRNKKWEVYVVTRIIHLLDDDNLEFACQQCVKDKGNDRFYLTDLCFPSLGLYIEVNEKEGHSDKNQKIKDRERQEAIQNSTSWKQLDIDTYEYNDDKKLMFLLTEYSVIAIAGEYACFSILSPGIFLPYIESSS